MFIINNKNNYNPKFIEKGRKFIYKDKLIFFKPIDNKN